MQNLLCGRLVQIERNAPALMQHHRAQIVNAVGLVGMLVGQKYRIDVVDMSVDQLLTQVGRGIDHDPRDAMASCAFDQQRATTSPVLRIPGIARSPAEGGPWNAGGRATAEDRQAHGHAAAFDAGTLLNRRKKFYVVCREISSSEAPRASASTLAISIT